MKYLRNSQQNLSKVRFAAEVSLEALSKLAVTFCAVLCSACGSNLGSDALSNGESLRVGETRELNVPIDYDYKVCIGDVGLTDYSTCTRPKEMIVYLPRGLSYAGEPETRVSASDVIFGEDSVPEPSQSQCSDGYVALVFDIPEIRVSDSEGDIVEDIIGDILARASEKFVFKVRGSVAGRALAVLSLDGDEGPVIGACGLKPAADQILRVDVVE